MGSTSSTTRPARARGRDVAVVGSGVAGLVAAHVLAKADRVTLYEADDRLGGHADTHRVVDDGRTQYIDTGFIVHNERTYPTLLRLFDELGVRTRESEMSMSVSSVGLEYAGGLGPPGLFPSWRNLVRPAYWGLLGEIVRFHAMARRSLATSSPAGEAVETLAGFLQRGRFTAYFRAHFITPLVAAVWSCDPARALDYPVAYLFAFLDHHGMLAVAGSPTWRTVVGGSADYVDKVAHRLAEVRTGCKVTELAEDTDGVSITDGSGAIRRYQAAVVATHPDQALAMLAEPTRAQREVLDAMPYSHNLAQLHTDTSLLPRHRRAWASWNYRQRRPGDAASGVLVSYDLTRLQRLPTDTRYLLTLNGADTVDPASVIETMEYAHPLYTPQSVAAQRRLPEINTDRVAFAGAYHGWGFHEDGARAGLSAAEHLGAGWPRGATRRLPQQSPASTPRIYATTIKHARTEPVGNRFGYRSYSWLVDLDHLSRPGWALGPLASFQARDHVGDPRRSLRDNLDALLADHGIDLGGGRIVMLSSARVLGYVFNPISVFWCYRTGGALACVVLEVHNTYGGRHAYVCHPDDHGRVRIDKRLYVSPFNDVSGGYDALVPEPTDAGVHVAVALRRDGHPPFTASLVGDGRPANPRSMLATVLRMPLAPLAVSARIRWQGIKLWARGVPVQPRPRDHEETRV